MQTLPLTILGGFLGAGKTTLVNHLLRHANGLRLAVLVNEFGELPIDEDLIDAQDDDLISISGGCVCCSYGSDLTRAMMDLAAMDPPPDHVLLEASGVAIPGAIAASVSLLPSYLTDGIIVLADAETLRQNAVDRYMGDTVLRQLDDADLLILNKCDLVERSQLATLRDWIEQRDGRARILETQHGIVDPAVMLDSIAGKSPPSAPVPTNPVNSYLLTPPNPVADVHAFAAALANDDLGLIRAKGFVTGPDGTRWLIQVVGRRATCVPAANMTPTADGIVCLGIGENMNRPALQSLGKPATVNA